MELTYSQLYKHSSYQCKISPDCKYVANTTETRLVIRDHSQDMIVMHVYETNYTIDIMSWSPDSQYILTMNREHAIVNIWSINDTNWKTTLLDKRFGMEHIWWSPDSSSVLITTELKLKLNIWMFKQNKIKYIQQPKFINDGCVSSPDGKYMAIVETKDARDYIDILDGKSFVLLQQFPVDTTDLAHVQWSPDSQFLAIYDNCLYYKFLVYRLDGYLAFSYSAYEYGLGIKSIDWLGSLLAIGSYDGKVQLINTVTWKRIYTLAHSNNIKPYKNDSLVIYEEYDLPNMNKRTLETKVGYRIIHRRPIQLPVLRPEYNKHDPNIGVSQCLFSLDGSFLFTRTDTMPNTLWIWDINQLECCYIVSQKHPIRQVIWNPKYAHVLAMICGDENLYILKQDETLVSEQQPSSMKTSEKLKIIPFAVPTSKFSVKQIEWSLDGKTLLLLDHQLYCLASLYLIH
ncbi:unnamed protein product [Cunninghamella echinulata]